MILLGLYISYCLFFLFDGYSDGKERYLGTEEHWIKYPQRLFLGFSLLFSWVYGTVPPFLFIVALIASFWPYFNIGCAKGLRQPFYYLGKTSKEDSFLVKLGLVRIEKTKFPIITLIYFILIFGSLLLVIHSIRT